jgi:phosphomannomutase
MGIFKANDIRGIYPYELNEKEAYKIGQAFTQYVKAQTIVLGRDNRISSPALAKATMQGIIEAGKNVIDIGVVDSPALYYSSWKLNMPGLMVTASHNPAEYNGFYIVDKQAVPIYQGNHLNDLEKIYQKQKRIQKKLGDVTRIYIKPEYKQHILSFHEYKMKPMKIVVDAGNGMGSVIAGELLKEFPEIQVIPLFFESDGRFPHRGPDTTVEKNLQPLIKQVRDKKADFGLAFDGDADRVAFVDEKGEIIGGSITGALIADYLLKNTKKEKIVASIGCSRMLTEVIQKHKAEHVREKVGHSFISDRMRKIKALFGVEQTGHFFYRNNFYTESPMITMLLVCSIYSEHNKKMSHLIENYKKYYMTQEINFPIENANKFMPKFKHELKKMYKTKIDTFDGLFIELKDLWFRIRPSQTESALRLTLEGKSKEQVDHEKTKLEALIKKTLSS